MNKYLKRVFVTGLLCLSFGVYANDTNIQNKYSTKDAFIEKIRQAQVSVSDEEFNDASHGIFSREHWVLFESGNQGGNEGVDYQYFYTEIADVYGAIIKYKQSVQADTLLLGTLYRSEKEAWNVITSKELDAGSFPIFRVDYQDESNVKDERTTIFYILDTPSGVYIVHYMIPSSSYEADIFDPLVINFKY